MTDKELKEAVEWHKGHYHIKECSRSAFLTYLGGFFHTFPRRAKFLMEEMENLGLISVSAQNVTIL